MRAANQHGQALIEWAASAFVLLLFGLGLLAVGQVVGEYMAIRAAATQAAFAAARAPSEASAQSAGAQAASEAIRGSQVQWFALSIDTNGFQRGAILTATATGCVSLQDFPIASQFLGQCVALRWQARAMIEPYRSRAG